MYIYTHIFVYTYFRKTQLAILGVASSLFTSETQVVEVETSFSFEVSSQRLCTSSSTLQPSLGDGQLAAEEKSSWEDSRISVMMMASMTLWSFFFLAVWRYFFFGGQMAFFVGQGSLLTLKVYCKGR